MYKNILLAVDLNDEHSWKKALPAACDIARIDNANLHVLTVIPDFGMSIVSQYFPEGYEKEIAEKTLGELKSFVAERVPDGIPVRHIVGEGTVYEIIIRMADEIKADLIVTAAGRPDLKEYLLGPKAARVARHSDVSVLIVR